MSKVDFDLLEALRGAPKVLEVERVAKDGSFPERLKLKSHPWVQACKLKVEIQGGLLYDLVVGIDKDFPFSLPDFCLADPQTCGPLNHVNYQGVVCYAPHTSFLVDSEHQEDVVKQALAMAIEVLSPEQQADKTELLDEFGGYWRSLPGALSDVVCLFEPELSGLKKISAWVKRNPARGKSAPGLPRVLFFDAPGTEKGPILEARLNGLAEYSGIYLPLVRPTLPPPPNSTADINYLRALVGYLSDEDRTELEALGKRRDACKPFNVLLFSQPRTTEGFSLFGALVQFEGRGWIFRDPVSVHSITPLVVNRHFRSHMVLRGGGEPKLQSKSVCIVGCGSVGCRVAEALALAGVGQIILVDDDTFEPANIHRHLLGAEALHINKAKALSDHLKGRLSYIKVEALAMSREECIQEVLPRVDLMVDATGDLGGARETNRKMLAGELPWRPFLATWLEPYDLGGHAVLCAGEGCLECLFTESGEPRRVPRISFLEPGQRYLRDMDGCDQFTPFSAMDAQQISLLATRLAIRHLVRGQKGGYLFWRGEGVDAVAQGVRTTEWFQRAAEKRQAYGGIDFRELFCPNCREPQ